MHVAEQVASEVDGLAASFEVEGGPMRGRRPGPFNTPGLVWFPVDTGDSTAGVFVVPCPFTHEVLAGNSPEGVSPEIQASLMQQASILKASLGREPAGAALAAALHHASRSPPPVASADGAASGRGAGAVQAERVTAGGSAVGGSSSRDGADSEAAGSRDTVPAR